MNVRMYHLSIDFNLDCLPIEQKHFVKGRASKPRKACFNKGTQETSFVLTERRTQQQGNLSFWSGSKKQQNGTVPQH